MIFYASLSKSALVTLIYWLQATVSKLSYWRESSGGLQGW